MAGAFKFLVIADGTPEFALAAQYAALRAKAVHGGLVILTVLEPSAPSSWISVDAQMREEARAAAETRLKRHASEIWAATGVDAETQVREGEFKAELRRLLDEDLDIRLMVLACGAGGEGPGPLVSMLAKIGAVGGRPLPVTVLPVGLDEAAIAALAAP